MPRCPSRDQHWQCCAGMEISAVFATHLLSGPKASTAGLAPSSHPQTQEIRHLEHMLSPATLGSPLQGTGPQAVLKLGALLSTWARSVPCLAMPCCREPGTCHPSPHAQVSEAVVAPGRSPVWTMGNWDSRVCLGGHSHLPWAWPRTPVNSVPRSVPEFPSGTFTFTRSSSSAHFPRQFLFLSGYFIISLMLSLLPPCGAGSWACG